MQEINFPSVGDVNGNLAFLCKLFGSIIMRLLKAPNTNLRNIYGKGVKYDINDPIIMDSTNVVLVPKGTEAQRLSSSANGHLRYNTDDDPI